MLSTRHVQGAIPEVANCRLSMLGVLAAIGAELATGEARLQLCAGVMHCMRLICLITR